MSIGLSEMFCRLHGSYKIFLKTMQISVGEFGFHCERETLVIKDPHTNEHYTEQKVLLFVLH